MMIYYYDVTELSDRALFDRGMNELPWEERAEKVRRFRFDKDKRLCLGAGLLLRHMLETAGAECLDMGFTPFGKPFLIHGDIHFNISHDGEIAVCAVSNLPVGADVQKLTGYDSSFAQAVLTPDEIIWTESSADPDTAFTRLWTRKESYLKLSGQGLSHEPKDFSVLPCSDTPDNIYFAEYTVPDHLICICCRESFNAPLTEWSYKQNVR